MAGRAVAGQKLPQAPPLRTANPDAPVESNSLIPWALNGLRELPDRVDDTVSDSVWLKSALLFALALLIAYAGVMTWRALTRYSR